MCILFNFAEGFWRIALWIFTRKIIALLKALLLILLELEFGTFCSNRIHKIVRFFIKWVNFRQTFALNVSYHR